MTTYSLVQALTTVIGSSPRGAVRSACLPARSPSNLDTALFYKNAKEICLYPLSRILVQIDDDVITVIARPAHSHEKRQINRHGYLGPYEGMNTYSRWSN